MQCKCLASIRRWGLTAPLPMRLYDVISRLGMSLRGCRVSLQQVAQPFGNTRSISLGLGFVYPFSAECSHGYQAPERQFYPGSMTRSAFGNCLSLFALWATLTPNLPLVIPTNILFLWFSFSKSSRSPTSTTASAAWPLKR